MKNIIFFLTTGIFLACGQKKNPDQNQLAAMDTTKLTNKTAREAFEAWQKADTTKWLAHFTTDAKLLDDGNPRDFTKFSTKAIGSEYFTSIDKVENNGLHIYGHFHSDTWGDFKTYFKFHLNANGKIYLLEIGQAE